MKWTWTHTFLLFALSLLVTYIVMVATGIVLFVLPFIPPAVHLWKKR